MSTLTKSTLAIRGGSQCVPVPDSEMFAWPIVTNEDEEAVLEVLRRGAMSGSDVTLKFEREFAEWMGTRHALGYCNGTASILGAMYGCGIGAGDEVICPSYTYWASVLQMLSLGASPVFADIDPFTFTLNPADIEHRVTPRTRAILVVHLFARPADMDPILDLAKRHGLKVIEDVSHAQGGFYKGKRLGTLGDAGAMSLMAGKSFAIGEAGILVTNHQSIFERAVAFGFYERTGLPTRFASSPSVITDPALKAFSGLPLGGVKHRMNQTCSAMGRVQLRHYDARIAEIDRAMNHFWDLLEGVPGIRPNRVEKGSGSTMGGWYCPVGRYVPEELGGLPISRFIEAVAAEGTHCIPSPYRFALHAHPMLHKADVYGHGKPTVLAHTERDTRQEAGRLPASEEAVDRVFGVPWFKHYKPDIIAQHAAAYRKVAENADQLKDRAS